VTSIETSCYDNVWYSSSEQGDFTETPIAMTVMLLNSYKTSFDGSVDGTCGLSGMRGALRVSMCDGIE
jgi:hypothetical protein